MNLFKKIIIILFASLSIAMMFLVTSNFNNSFESQHDDESNTNVIRGHTTILLEANGGKFSNNTTEHQFYGHIGETLDDEMIPLRNGYQFLGYTRVKDDLSTLWDFDHDISMYDMNLYAYWQEANYQSISDNFSCYDFTPYQVEDVNLPQGLMIKYSSKQVEVNSKNSYSAYDLNNGFKIDNGYQLTWSKDVYGNLIIDHNTFLQYGDNFYYAQIIDEDNNIVETYQIKIYVLYDYVYTFYECQPGYDISLRDELGTYKTISVIEGETPKIPASPKNGFEFISWVSLNDHNVYSEYDFSLPATQDVEFYATYQDIIINIDGNSQVVYQPLKTTQVDLPDSIYGEHDMFTGMYINSECYINEYGEVLQPISVEIAANLKPSYSDYTPYNYFSFEQVDDGYKVTLNYVPDRYTKIVVPSIYEGQNVVEIATYCFSFGDIEQIVLPNTIKRIDCFAFARCYSLKEIEIPSSVIEISFGAFYDCGSLKTMTLPFVGKKITSSNNQAKFAYLFAQDEQVTSYSIPRALERVIINGSESKTVGIGSYAFSNCSMEVVELYNVYTISDNAFTNSSIQKVYISNDIHSIGANAFSSCDELFIFFGWTSRVGVSDWNTSSCPYFETVTREEFDNYIIDEGLLYYLNRGKFTLVGYNKTISSDIVLPSSLQLNGQTYEVNSMSRNVLANVDTIHSIYIPSSFVEINANALSGERYVIYCEAKENLETWSTLWAGDCTNIYYGVNKDNLITIDGINYYVENDEAIATLYSGIVTEVIIPDVIDINNNQYRVTKIGSYAFYNRRITNLTLPSYLKEVDSYAFYNLKSEELVLVFPSTLEKIGDYAFYNSENLFGITFKNGVQSIGRYAFYNCYNLESVYIPKSLQTLSYCAFGRKNALGNAFYHLTKFYFEAESIPSSWTSGIVCEDFPFYFGVGEENLFIYNGVAYVLKDQQAIATSYRNFYVTKDIEIPEKIVFKGLFYQVVEIGKGAFYSASFYHMEKFQVTLPSSVTTIDDYAFSYAYWLKGISLNQVTYIGNEAFRYSRLEEITIPKSVVEIGESVFADTNITKAIIEASISELPNNTFSLCRFLTYVTLPNTITKIGDYCFENCVSLTALTLPVNLTTIGEYAFSRCQSITTLTIPSQVTYIGKYAFSQNKALQSVYFDCDTFENILSSTFSGCNSLTSMALPKYLISIGDLAFSNCTSLTNLTIPKNVNYIGKKTFLNCTDLVLYFEASDYDVNTFASNWSQDVKSITKSSNNYVFSTPKDDTLIVDGDFLVGYFIYQICYSGAKIISITYPHPQYMVIPSEVTINGTTYPVTLIGSNIFTNSYEQDYVFIPSSIITIDASAFNSSHHVVFIAEGTETYYWNKNWKSDEVVVYDQVNESDIFIQDDIIYLFKDKKIHVVGNNNQSQSNFVIPNRVIFNNAIYNVTCIDDYAFYDCSNLVSITLPSTLIELGDGVFLDDNKLVEIDLPDSLQVIGKECFAGCTLLNYIFLSSNINIIKEGAFTNNPALILYVEDETLSSNWSSSYKDEDQVVYYGINENTYTIKDGLIYIAFANNALLSGYTLEMNADIILPSLIKIGTVYYNLTRIGEKSFYQNQVLEEIEISSSITTIYPFAFYNCNNLVKVNIPLSVYTIGEKAFFNNAPTKIYVEASYAQSNWNGSWVKNYLNVVWESTNNNVVTIDNIIYQVNHDDAYIIGYDNQFSNTLVIPSYITFEEKDYPIVSVEEGAFENYNYQFDLTLPEGLLSIKDLAFKKSRITAISLPESLVYIGEQAFYGCTYLTSIYIPSNVTYVGTDCFTWSMTPKIYSSLLEAPSTWEPRWNSMNNIVYWNCNENNYIIINDLVYVIENGNASVTSFYLNIESLVVIPDKIKINSHEYTITSINDLAFYIYDNNYRVKSVQLPETITNIGKSAFGRCTGLSSINLPQGLTSIGACAFSSCTKLKSIVLPDNLTTISRGLFSSCTNLASVNIPSKVTLIEDYAFSECENLTNIIIPDGVTYIGAYAFEKCTSLNKIFIPKSVNVIKKYAFYNSTSLSIFVETNVKPDAWDEEWNITCKGVYYGISKDDYYH